MRIRLSESGSRSDARGYEATTSIDDSSPLRREAIREAVPATPVGPESSSSDLELRDALCLHHGYLLGGDGMPYPLSDDAVEREALWAQRNKTAMRGKRQRLVSVRQRASAPAPAANTTTLLKLSLAAAVPSSADAFVAESVSHGATWFAIGTILMGLLILLTIFKMYNSRPLSQRLSTQCMHSLTLSGILAIMAIFEVECLTELCHHEQRYLYNVSVTSMVGIS